ncbi:MAG: CBS domain-containing protein [Actinomycetota bacterium]
MRSLGMGALPVVDAGRLVGLVTEHDFLDIAGKLLLDELERAAPVTDEPEP